MTAHQELTGLARNHGWEVGEYAWHTQARKTGFTRASVQVRVEWTEAGSVARAQRIAPGRPQVGLDRTDRDKRTVVASWLTEASGAEMTTCTPGVCGAKDAHAVITGALTLSRLIDASVASRLEVERLAGEILTALRHNGFLAAIAHNPVGPDGGGASPIGLHDVTFDRSRVATADLDAGVAQALDRKGITDPAMRASWRETLRSVADIPRWRPDRLPS